MAEWLRAWDTVAMMKLWRREVVSSIPDRGTIVGRVFSPTRQLVRFSHLNVPFSQNSEFIWNIVPVAIIIIINRCDYRHLPLRI